MTKVRVAVKEEEEAAAATRRKPAPPPSLLLLLVGAPLEMPVKFTQRGSMEKSEACAVIRAVV